ncbi:hypothetical protein [Plantactinospora sp. ZYX-F-223]|uniref:hypothetical protein n=1 Tax=Plantactinospora sp. ZYX-F-223 TaxID=3144103 RepID=UPI0031FDCE55
MTVPGRVRSTTSGPRAPLSRWWIARRGQPHRSGLAGYIHEVFLALATCIITY